MEDRPLYVYLDEGGNFDFSPSGTGFFTLTAIAVRDPVPIVSAVWRLRDTMIRGGFEVPYFHATEDPKPRKRRVFKLIADNAHALTAHSVVVHKNRTNPKLYEPRKFYSLMFHYVMRHTLEQASCDQPVSDVHVVTDRLPVNNKRKAVEKAVKTNLAELLKDSQPYSLVHHDSRCHFCLQLADYVNWAILRHWESGDSEWLSGVDQVVHCHFPIFRNGATIYYQVNKPH